MSTLAIAIICGTVLGVVLILANMHADACKARIAVAQAKRCEKCGETDKP